VAVFVFTHVDNLRAANHLHDGKEHDCTEHGDEEAVEVKAIYATLTKHAHDPATKHGSDDTNDDIKQQPLLSVRLHDH